jgi:hypothetical protein
VYLAARERSGGFRWKYSSLSKAAAHQGVLVPEIAFAHPANFIRRGKMAAKPDQEQGQGQQRNTEAEAEVEESESVPPQPQEFLILRLPEFGGSNCSQGQLQGEALDLPQLYYRRLDALSRVPLLPEWANWLWQYSLSQGLVNPLPGQGCEAYLCSQPDDTALAEAVKAGLLNGELDIPGQLKMKEEAA